MKVKTNLQSNDTLENLGQIIIELTEMNYNQIIEYVLPIVLEKSYQSMSSQKELNSNSLLISILELLYQEKNLSIEAVKAAVQVLPTSIKEELLQIIIRSPQIKEILNERLTPFGMSLGRVEIIENLIDGE